MNRGRWEYGRVQMMLRARSLILDKTNMSFNVSDMFASHSGIHIKNGYMVTHSVELNIHQN